MSKEEIMIVKEMDEIRIEGNQERREIQKKKWIEVIKEMKGAGVDGVLMRYSRERRGKIRVTDSVCME